MPRNDAQQIEVQAQPRDGGVAGDVASDLASLPYVRLTQRRPPPRDRKHIWALLALVLAAHVLLVWLAWLILRPSPNEGNESGVMAVTLIEPTAALPLPPPLVPPPPLPGRQAQPAPPPPPRHYVPPAKGAISATLEGATGQPLKLYRPNGQILLPSKAPAASAPVYRAPELHGSQIYDGKSPITYKPTIFNKAWAPINQSLGAKTVGRAFDKAVDKTTVQKTVTLPGGIKVHCAVSPLVLFLGCGPTAPQPPPENDHDVRLSMPPPQTLTGKKVPLPASASSAAQPAVESSGH